MAPPHSLEKRLAFVVRSLLLNRVAEVKICPVDITSKRHGSPGLIFVFAYIIRSVHPCTVAGRFKAYSFEFVLQDAEPFRSAVR